MTTNPDDPNASGNHRKNIVQSLEAGLKRMDTEYIDPFMGACLGFYHPDPKSHAGALGAIDKHLDHIERAPGNILLSAFKLGLYFGGGSILDADSGSSLNVY